MRSLVISQYAILDESRCAEGIYSRLRLFLRAISEVSDTIDYLALVRPDELAAHSDMRELSAAQSDYWRCPTTMSLVAAPIRAETAWNHYGAGIFSAARQPVAYQYAGAEQIEAVKQHLDREYDLVFVMGLPAMNAVLKSRRHPKRLFFDLNDIEHRVRFRSALSRPLSLGSAGYLAHTPALWAAERQAVAMSKMTFVCSETDRHYLRRALIGPRVIAIPNAVPFPRCLPKLASAPTALFLGGYYYKPNRDAAQRLASRIWPMVRRQHPDAVLVLAGRSAEQIPCFHQPPPGVEIAGFVDDVASLYDRCRIVVCPITVGGGTRVKLIEASGYGKPIVTSTIGVEGLDFRDGKEVLIRDSDEAIAAACLSLLTDDALAESLGRAARDRSEGLYESEAVQRRIVHVLGKASPLENWSDADIEPLTVRNRAQPTQVS